MVKRSDVVEFQQQFEDKRAVSSDVHIETPTGLL